MGFCFQHWPFSPPFHSQEKRDCLMLTNGASWLNYSSVCLAWCIDPSIQTLIKKVLTTHVVFSFTVLCAYIEKYCFHPLIFQLYTISKAQRYHSYLYRLVMWSISGSPVKVSHIFHFFVNNIILSPHSSSLSYISSFLMPLIFVVVYFEEEPNLFWRAKIRHIAVYVVFLGWFYQMRKSSRWMKCSWSLCQLVIYLRELTLNLI